MKLTVRADELRLGDFLPGSERVRSIKLNRWPWDQVEVVTHYAVGSRRIENTHVFDDGEQVMIERVGESDPHENSATPG